MKLQLVATCLFGLEKYLGDEIDALGCRRIDTMDGRITFEGTLDDIARANINLRCAERIYVKLGSFEAHTFTELYDGVKALPLDDWIGPEDAFPVKGHSIRSLLTSIPDCQSIIKKAAVDRLKSCYGIEWFEESGNKYQIEFFIFKDVATVMIDTTGIPLHKRGYRPDAGIAPLRETLAAAMAINAHLRDDVLLWDPFCGSGTIAIEAAMLMCNIAPGLNRRFVSERFESIPEDSWKRAREEARAKIIPDASFEVFASDIDPLCVELARSNADRAGVGKYVKTFRMDALTISQHRPEGRKGTIICNPPYGERMGEKLDVERLYRKMGFEFSKLSPWQIYVITSCDYFEKLYGRRADKIRKLYNGMIPCNLYQFFRPATARKPDAVHKHHSNKDKH
ncbi:MAG: class I SAM-dependent RNA methyltransferase [Clostridia bacterium]|nr:class I SAM-dependent RNA methyltransferase [Clostridia bacterium]